jgi:hypothetical protein
MPYFASLRETNCSSFYNRLWTELEQIKIIDTHEHWRPPAQWNEAIEKTNVLIPHQFGGCYLYGLPAKLDVKGWLEHLNWYKNTAYLKSMLWSIEELYGLEPPVTIEYLEQLDAKLKELYQDDPVGHMKDVIENHMYLDMAILNIDIDAHVEMSTKIPAIHAAAGIPAVMDGIQVPRQITPGSSLVYRFAAEHLDMQPSDFHGLDVYRDATKKLLDYFKTSGNYICLKNQCAYTRPLYFPEPDEDTSSIAKLYNKPRVEQQDLWKFGDYMFHFMLEWTAMNWKVPVQMHTGLARMYFGDSNAINMSHLYEKFPDLKFDLFHGNYPYNNLAGMLHQISNITADLCWLPIISPTACQRTLTELIEVGTMVGSGIDSLPGARTSVFGGDCQTVEGSYGALLMAKDVVIRTLEDLHARGIVVTEADAIDLAEQVLHGNPKRIFSSN